MVKFAFITAALFLLFTSISPPAHAAGGLVSRPISSSLPVATARTPNADLFHGGASVHGFGTRYPPSRLSSAFQGAAQVHGFGTPFFHSRLGSDIFHGGTPTHGFGTRYPPSRLSSGFQGAAQVHGFGTPFFHSRLNSDIFHGSTPIHGLGAHFPHHSDAHSQHHSPPVSLVGSGGSIQFVRNTAVFPGGRVSIVENVVTIGASTDIFGRYSFLYNGFNATGRFSDVGGIWRFTVNAPGLNANFMINQQGQMLTGDGMLFSNCILCGGTGNVGAFNGLGNLSTTSGNNNVGLFNGDFNTALYSGNSNVGLLNGDFNGGAFNGNGNFGLFNGNFNGVGYSIYSRSGRLNGNNNYGVFNGNFNGDSNIFQARIYH
jgi:hypothetical protein